MQAELQKTSPMAFAQLFRDGLLQALSTQCGSAWTPAATVAENDTDNEAESFHAIFSFEGCLNGDLHLNLATDAALAIASALQGQVSEVIGDAQRDALVEFLDAALPGFCESAVVDYGIFTASLTVTSNPTPNDPESHTFTVIDAQGAELQFHLLVASDLVASLVEQSLVKQAEAIEAEATLATSNEVEPQPPTGTVETPVTPLTYGPATGDPVNLDLVLEVELSVTLRFGQRQLTLREVLELTSGSVIELDRQVEEPVELLLDGRVIARGEAVVIDGNYGLRVTEVPQQFTTSMLR